MRVMIDAGLVDDQPPPGVPQSPRDVLWGLLHSPLVTLLKFADDGPPPGTTPGPAPDCYQGWAVITQRDDAQHQWAVSLPTGATSWSLAGVIGNAVDVAEQDASAHAYRDLPVAEAALRRRADCLAAQVAVQAVQADLFISERPYLHSATWNVARGVAVVDVAEALALLGLYHRSQGNFPVAHRLDYNRGLFFWVGTREVLPDAWRWFSACVQSSEQQQDDSLMLLGGSLLERVNRALEARDAVHLALNRAQNNDTQDEALAQLDFVLLSLMGAVDVSARVAHRALGLRQQDEYRAAWQANRAGQWLTRVDAVHPSLAQVVHPGSAGENALTVLRLLRNSVHGEALQGLAVSGSGKSLESLVGLPRRDQPLLLAAMDALGGRTAWGARSTLPGRIHLDAGVLVDRLFEESIGLLNRLMRNTPVERLPGVALTPSNLGPPADGPTGRSGPFDSWARKSIRWQLGL